MSRNLFKLISMFFERITSWIYFFFFSIVVQLLMLYFNLRFARCIHKKARVWIRAVVCMHQSYPVGMLFEFFIWKIGPQLHIVPLKSDLQLYDRSELQIFRILNGICFGSYMNKAELKYILILNYSIKFIKLFI